MTNRVLMAYGSKHGATAEIAEAIGEMIREAGLDVDVLRAGAVKDLAPYAAVVLGIAVYAGRWHKEAVRFLEAQAAVESKVNDALDVGALPVVIGQNSPCSSYAIAKCVAEHTEGDVGIVSLDMFHFCKDTGDTTDSSL